MRQEFPHPMTLDFDLDQSTVPTDPRQRPLFDHQPSLLGSLVAALERIGPRRRAQVAIDRVRPMVDRVRAAAEWATSPTEPGLDEQRSWVLLAPASCGGGGEGHPAETPEMAAMIDQFGD